MGLFLCACNRKEEVFLLEEIETPVLEEDVTTLVEPELEAEVAENMAIDIYVHICGAVNLPGVYKVPQGSRVQDVIVAAGGLTNEAEGDYINQAQLVSDGSKIVVPTQSEIGEESLYSSVMQEKSTQQESGLININTSTLEQLCQIPGVGKSRAQSILDYRDANGSFKNIEDIMNIDGIKSGSFEKMRDLITVK